MDPDQSMQATVRRRYREQLMKIVAEFSLPCAGSQRDAEQIRQHSPLNAPQHLGAGAAPAAAEASTSTNMIDPGTSKEQASTTFNPIDRGSSKERHSEGEMRVKTLLTALQRRYLATEGLELEREEIQNVAKDVIKFGFNAGELSSDEVGALQAHFSIHPAVDNKGSPTEIIDDTGCNASLDDADLPEDKITEHDADFFNAFEDDFDGRDLD